MLFHEKVVGHVIIGEATLNLALGDRDISVQALIAELGRMAEREENDERLAQIADARSWLKNFVQPERIHQTQTEWQPRHYVMNRQRYRLNRYVLPQVTMKRVSRISAQPRCTRLNAEAVQRRSKISTQKISFNYLI